MKFIEGQILSVFSQVLRCHAEITSGAYKLRKMQRGCEESETGWRDLTEEELLQDSMRTMEAQISRLNECTEALPTEEDEMSRDNEPTECGHFIVQVVTDAALLVVDADGGEYWIPKSQICDESDIDDSAEAGDQGELTLPEWLAIEKGFV